MTSIKHCARVLTFLLAIFTSTVWAESDSLLNDLHQMRLSSINTLTNFYMFTGLDADSKYDRRIQSSVKEFAALLERANQSAQAATISDTLNSVKKEWEHLNRLLQQNRQEMISKGVPNVRLVYDMGMDNLKIVQSLSTAYQKILERPDNKFNTDIESIHSLALIMAEITSQYAARGTTNLGPVFVGNSSKTLEQMAASFRSELEKLKGNLKDTKADSIVGSIYSKWKFMEKSVNNYNENTVPFLVVSYNDRILAHLKELEDKISQ